RRAEAEVRDRKDQGRAWRCAAGLLLAVLVAACSARVQEIGPPIVDARLLPDALVTPDGAVLPVRVWQPEGGPEAATAVILALHGFNDYSRAFERPAPALTEAGILVYAYDQRGFGRTREPGIWAGTEVLIADAERTIAMVRDAHPGLPLYVMGESMGGAVATAAVARTPEKVDGLILVAPAYWGWRSMTTVEGLSLELMTWLTPWLPLTGQGLRIVPSDNLEVLRELAADPLVLKEARVDGIFGLVGLMDIGYAALPEVRAPILMLYGAREDVLPERAVRAAVAQLERCRSAPGSMCAPRAAFYDKGYHLLLRDLNAPVVLADIVTWIHDPNRPLPSGADHVPLPEEFTTAGAGTVPAGG
ncbi:MAG: alpha/beta fold hydrolase, partial [Alphaproteobacteria bacterium]